jgi:hypothetical protein
MELSKTAATTVKSWRDNPEKVLEWVSMGIFFFFLAWFSVRALVYASADVASMISSISIDESRYVAEHTDNNPWKAWVFGKDNNVIATHSDGVEKYAN